jgi:hypothetical protein
MLVSVLRFTDSDYTCVWLPLWLFWLCWCLSFDLRILITLVSDYPSGSFDYVGVCPSIYRFWLHLCLIIPLILLIMLVSVLRFTDSDYTCVWLPLWFFWLCWCLSFELRILITLVSGYPSGSSVIRIRKSKDRHQHSQKNQRGNQTQV